MTKKTPLILAVILLLSVVGFRPNADVTAPKAAPINVEELTIAQIHAAYRKGAFTSQQLVAAYLERINQFNTQVNAISTINPQASAIAKALDEEYKRTKVLRPLHGIPIIVKDNINTKGLATTAGALALKDFVPDADAFIIDKLVKAGAIIIAKSNMAEWAFTPWHSFSSTHGATLNPYNPEYVPAGSSGGTGASVASNFATVGLGTDTGNSIRGPASHCSLVGFRTTLGLISRADIVPLNFRNDVVGPMCRSVEDATRVMEIMVGYDPNDPITNYSEGKIPKNYTQFLQKNGLKGARIGVLRELCENPPTSSVADPEVKALFEKAISDMKALGAVIVDPLTVADFSNLRKDVVCFDFRGDLEAYLAKYVKNDTIKTLEDIVRIGSKSKSAEARVIANLTVRNPNCPDVYTSPRRIAFRKAIEDKMDELKLDAIIYPTWNNKPAKINSYNEELKRVDYFGDNSQIIAPHTGQPAFTVPMGFTSGNLPAGLQFLGRMYAEPTLIKLVYSYEQGTKHRVPPTLKK
ncbi:amidase [Runella sp.]|uniref:amidase n=1 Tax=Runella sp. TaxID=1960881 RepID=UPI003D143AFF